MNVNDCFIIRCTDIGKQERQLHKVLSSVYDADNIFFCCDAFFDEQGSFDGSDKRISLPKFLERAKLNVNVNKLGWRCGDHCFYATYDKYPEYRYYWLIESDVYIDESSLALLIQETEQKDQDLLIHNLKLQNQHWLWYYHYHYWYPTHQIYSGLFPLVRLSNKAVKFAYQARCELASRKNIHFYNYPNDESFICSMLANHGFSIDKLETTDSRFFNLIQKKRTHIPAGVIAHPVINDYEEVQQTRLFSKQKPDYLIELIKQNNYDPDIINKTIFYLFEQHKHHPTHPPLWKKVLNQLARLKTDENATTLVKLKHLIEKINPISRLKSKQSTTES